MVAGFQHVQRFQHRGSLAPKARLVYLIAVVVGRHRLFDSELEGRHIFIAQQAAVGFHKGINLLSDIAPIEVVSDGIDLGDARNDLADYFFDIL